MPPYGAAVVTRPPKLLLFGAVGLDAVSLLLLIPRTMPMSALGYLIAPLAVTAVVVLYRIGDIKASQSLFYSPSSAQRRAVMWTTLFAFLIGVGHSWIIATEIAKGIAS